MAACDPRCRMKAHFLLMLALGIPSLVVGCGGGESGAKPAPVEAAQAKKAQAYMAGYREQIVADNKAKANDKAKAAPKKSP
jgi:hypothetical protein